MTEEFSNAISSEEENPIGEKLNQILSDPESMARLAKMASSLSATGLLDSLGMHASEMGSDPGTSPMSEPKTADTPIPTQPETGGIAAAQLFSGKNRHTALLRALKPYLGTEKRDRVDRMLKLLQLAEVAGTVLYSEKDG